MKGIIFTSFLEMVEEKIGIDFVDEIIEETNLPSGGAYTSVGNYDHNELFDLVKITSEKSSEPIDDLLLGFGHYLFSIFVMDYKDLIGEVSNTLDFLARVETYIHPEVRKLYPDAHPPTFQVELRENDKMIFVYKSKRSLSMVAKGLIEKSAEHFGESFLIEMEKLDENGNKVRFILSRE
jgi:hypothetical protein